MFTRLIALAILLTVAILGARAAPVKESKPLTPETILKNKFEGAATVEFVVGEVHTVNFDSVFKPDVAHALMLQVKVAGAKAGEDFCVVVNRETATRLLKLGIDDPAKHFAGKFVRVTGTVERVTRVPAPSELLNTTETTSLIRVTNLDQLELIKKP